jgi:hypothetical protein
MAAGAGRIDRWPVELMSARMLPLTVAMQPGFHDMSSLIFRTICAAALPLSLAACASLTDDERQQQLEVHTILDHREVAGIGCVLSNDTGRWFVVAPGRVTVGRSSGPLVVDCARQGAGSAISVVGSRFDAEKLLGNLVVSAGLGDYLDRRTGAGFSYPSTLTVLMREAPASPAGPAQAREPADTLF